MARQQPFRNRLRRFVGRAASHHVFRRMVRMSDGFAPTISFTFDDFPQSAVDIGWPVLRSAGMAATWYTATGIIGCDSSVGRIASASSIVELHRAGNEIGDHTRRHILAESVSGEEYGQDLVDNQAALAAIVPDLVVRSFSYPFGSFTPRTKRAAMAHSVTCRSTERGIIRGEADLALLPANRLFSSEPLAEVEKVIDDVRRSGGWAIFYTHDIAENPSPWGCTPDYFARAVDAVARAGLAVRTVGEAAALIRQG